ncbi:HAD family hydrolase [Cytobacillus sp. FJAT-53684]|uniref:HAD family hydrolase n=1 Tax=Cytobacillus mangrovibacter TaxID=3299024 RepID=A0ABW6JXK0_9BACI
MIMFASDLDRTLIYSKRALTEFKQYSESNLIGVEQKDGQEVAFMTNKAYDLLNVLASNLMFVPVTTRTYEQYKRIFILSDRMSLKYAVTSNGANIIYNGLPLLDWRNQVQMRLEHECTSLEKMIVKTEQLEINGQLKQAENLFFYYILEEELTAERKDTIRKMADANGWRISIQGRKLYLMPNPVSKGEAIKFIKDREGIHTVYGAGDSALDYDFLKLCHYSYIPSHGELVNEELNKDKYIITKKHGVQAGEELLSEMANILQETNI